LDRTPSIGAVTGKGASRFQILSLDGGGYKGIFSAAVLAAIEEDLGCSVVDHFDLIVGTSTGGIIALGLGAGMSPSQIVDFYGQFGSAIFRSPGLTMGWGLWGPKYRPDTLRRALSEVLGDTKLGESRVRLVIPAYDLTRDSVYLFKTDHQDRLNRDWRERMVDVAMATSAAPTYFPASSLRHVRLVDGGLWANNPILVGITEAVSLCGAQLEGISALSLGTTSELTHRPPSLDHGGITQWARVAVEVVLHGQSVGAAGMAEHLLTQERYVRHDPVVPASVLRMDRVDTAALLGLARSTSRDLVPEFKRKFEPHRAATFQSHHFSREETAS
jgi:hypothetical protein